MGVSFDPEYDLIMGKQSRVPNLIQNGRLHIPQTRFTTLSLLYWDMYNINIIMR